MEDKNTAPPGEVYNIDQVIDGVEKVVGAG
jgi:hypothetical protein